MAIGDKGYTLLISANDQATAKWSAFASRVQGDMAKMSGAVSSFGRIAGTILTGALVKKVIDSAKAQAMATASLTNALQNAGIQSAEVAKGMEQYASSVQAATLYGDEMVIQAQATLVAFTGLAGKGLEPAVQAAVDLAAAFDMDLAKAAMLIGKSTGATNALARYGIQVDSAASKSEKLAQIVEFVSEKFGGRAAAMANTATGKIVQMTNALDDVAEVAGELLAQSIAPIIKDLTIGLPYVGKAIATIFQVAKVAITGVLQVAVTLFAAVEHFGNAVGLWQSKTFENAMKKGMTMLAEGTQDIADIWKDEAIPSVEAYGKAVGDADDETEAIVAKIEKMAATELVFLDDEQAARFEASNKFMQKVADFFKQPPEVRQFLMLDKFKADIATAGAELKGVMDVDFIEPMWDAITDLGVGWNTLFAGIEAGLNRVAGAVGRSLEEWFGRVFDGVNSLLEEFTVGVLQAIAQIATRLAAAAAVAAIFQLVSGGTFGFGQIFGALTGIKMHSGGTVPKAHEGMYVNAPPSQEFPILVRGGETVRTESQEAALRGGGNQLSAKIDELIAVVRLQAGTPIVIQGAMDGQKFFKANWPAYDQFRRKKEV